MELNFNEVNNILVTLPIGLYAKRRVPCTLDAEAETSYYVPAEDTIVVSYPIIAKGAKDLEETPEFTKESVVRTMLYHEVSHAILTPARFTPEEWSWYCRKDRELVDAYNIFEDERIETLLCGYFLDVDFKKQVYYINGNTIPTPTTPLMAFYNLVRFRVDFHGLLPRVNEIISKYPASVIYNDLQGDGLWDAGRYINDIKDLLDDVRNYFPKSSSSTSAVPSYVAVGAITSDKALKEVMSKAGMDEIRGGRDGGGGPNVAKLLDKANFVDMNIYKTLEGIINQFNKKNNMANNGMSAYSGVISPRNFLRDDYKYFDKKVGVNGNNKYGALHLNLMLDNSGSYCDNEQATNKIIQALIEIEKANNNFTFDVYFVANDYKKAKTNAEKYIVADGGNQLTSDLLDLVRDAQKPGTYNYNIVMYDGIAYCNTPSAKYFKAYNRDNLTIISDYSNESQIEKFCPNANKIFIRDHYPERISDEVAKALTRAFR